MNYLRLFKNYDTIRRKNFLDLIFFIIEVSRQYFSKNVVNAIVSMPYCSGYCRICNPVCFAGRYRIRKNDNHQKRLAEICNTKNTKAAKKRHSRFQRRFEKNMGTSLASIFISRFQARTFWRRIFFFFK